MPADDPEGGAAPGTMGDVPVYGLSANDPDGRLIDRGGVSEADIAQITGLMQALGALRDEEDRFARASEEYMNLGRTDMRALHFLIVAENLGRVVTAAALAAHLQITSASTTKLLDRLERAGHITRSPHPSDRRALAVRVTAQTRRVATATVGVYQARRFRAAARLTSAEREVVTRFLRDMTDELAAGDAPAPESDGSARRDA